MAARSRVWADEQGVNSRYDFRQLRFRDSANQLDVASFPIDIPQMIGQHHGCGSIRVRDLHFKCVTLRLSRCGAQDTQACFAIVTSRTDNHRWTTTCLFMPSNRTKRNPDQVAAIGDMVRCLLFHSITSRPTSGPKSVSPCNCEGRQSFSNSHRLSFFDRIGRITNSPPRTCRSTAAPSSTDSCPASA